MRRLHDIVDAAARSGPDAIVFESETVTTAAGLALSSRRAAGWLEAAGIAAGDRLALIAGQSEAAATLHVAASRIGAVVAPVSRAYRGGALQARLDAVAPSLVLDDARVAEASRAWGSCAPLDGSLTGDAEGLMWLVPTSGTTREPRVVALPHRVLDGRMDAFAAIHGEGPGVFFSPADWAWIGGFLDALWAPLAAGFTVRLDAGAGRLDAARLRRDLAQADAAFLPPASVRALRALGPVSRRLRSLHTAGEVLNDADADWARQHLADRVHTVYGLTEAAFLLCADVARRSAAQHLGDVAPGGSVQVVEDELCVAPGAPTLMQGYWRPDGTVQLPLDGGWFRTGDAAHLEADHVILVGRQDDIMQVHGVRVSTAEVEACLVMNDAVAAAAAVAVSTADGMRLHAFVEPARPVTDPAREALALRRWVAENLSRHARPADIRFIDSLPRTPSGKVARAILRQQQSS